MAIKNFFNLIKSVWEIPSWVKINGKINSGESLSIASKPDFKSEELKRPTRAVITIVEGIQNEIFL
jgi:hypothetical protein